jgi:oligopeptidase B
MAHFKLASVASCDVSGRQPTEAGPGLPGTTNSGAAPAPVAPQRPHVHILHGDERTDEYHWLRDKASAEVIAHLRAEDAHANAVMHPMANVQEQLYREILGRIKETDLSVPYREGGYFYYYRTEEGKQYPIHYRKPGDLEAAEEVLVDINELARGQPFMAVGLMAVSNDGRLLAYTVDNSGFREYRLQILDLHSRKHGSESVSGVKSVAWAPDNRTLFYTIDDHAKRSYRLYRHQLAQPHEDDQLIFEEADERFRVEVWQSRSRDYLFAASVSFTTTEIRYLRGDQPAGSWQRITPREAGHEYYVDHRGDQFYIRTNDRGRNFRLAIAPTQAPGRKNWKELIAHHDRVMITGLSVFADHIVISEREDGLPHLRIADPEARQSHRIAMPEAVYMLLDEPNREFGTHCHRFNYQSLTTPATVFDYDMRSRTLTRLKETEVLGGYDRTRYHSERIHAAAADGEQIPISLVFRADLDPRALNPVHLVGYGAYGFPFPVWFSAARVSLLDRGVIVAIAHVRGGGEMGKQWHDQGRMLHKRNTFSDFISAAEHLVSEGYTASTRLTIEGGSGGGMLIGAALNMRPELFRAAILHVPFVDVLNTMLDESLPLVVAEFEEWGDPRIEEQYRYIKSYCPYENLAEKAYPAILVKTGFNDSQVMYWEPAKYVARLRALKTDDCPLLFKINMDAGHLGSSGRYDRLREVAFDYAFLLWQLGLIENNTDSIPEAG